MQRTNKALDTGLASLMKAPGTLSRKHFVPLPPREGLRSPSRKVSTTGLHDPENQLEKEKERERETKKTWGPKL